MIWTNITTGTPVRATNAKTLSGVLPGRTLAVRASHPGSGPDALLKVVNASGVVVSQIALSAMRPEPPADYFEPVGDANGVYNYILEPVGATWPSPGISLQVGTEDAISIPLTPSSDGTALVAPSPIVQADGLLKSNGLSVPWANTRKALMRARIGGGNLRIGIVGDSTVTGMGAVTGTTNIVGCRPRSI